MTHPFLSHMMRGSKVFCCESHKKHGLQRIVVISEFKDMQRSFQNITFHSCYNRKKGTGSKYKKLDSRFMLKMW